MHTHESKRHCDMSVDKFSLLIDAFMHATEVMRYHEVEQTSGEIARIYSIITGNTYLLAKCNTGIMNVASEFKAEMAAFVEDRIILMIESVIPYIIARFKLGLPNSSDEAPKLGNIKVSAYTNKTLHDLQLIDFEVIQLIKMIEYAANSENFSDEQQFLPSSPIYSAYSALTFLIISLSKVITANRMNTKSKVKLILRNDDDSSSLRCITILAYLVAKVAYSLFKITTCSCDVVIREARFKYAGDELSKYSNIGSLSFSSIISCFSNINVLEAGVSDYEGGLTTDQRAFLYDIITMSKILQVN